MSRNNLVRVLCALLFAYSGEAQINLVRNPSFEQYAQCQPRTQNIKYANYWTPISDTVFSATDTLGPVGCTPEFCHTCMPHYCQVSIPLSTWYYHYPRTGNGMAHVIMYHSDTVDTPSFNRRDYLQGRLLERLTNAKKYSCFFYISFIQTSAYACNNIGAYLDDGSIDTTTQCGMPQTMYHPQINDTSIYTDTLHWRKIEGTFIANGTEKFVTIGNFFDDAHTNAIYINYWNYGSLYPAHYLIDDVGVIDCDNKPFAGEDTIIHPGDSTFIGPNETLLPYTWYVLGGTTPIDSGGGIWVHPTVTTTYVLKQVLCGVTKYDTVTVYVWPVSVGSLQSAVSSLRVYPNPAVGEIRVDGALGCEVSILDLVGREVMTRSCEEWRTVVDVSSLTKGVYVVKVTDKVTGESVTRKLIKE